MCLSGWYLKRKKRAVNDETLYSFLYLTLTCLDFVENTYTYKSHVDDSEEDDDSDLAKLRASFCYGRQGMRVANDNPRGWRTRGGGVVGLMIERDCVFVWC